jgi:hypothetical protein
MARLSLQARFCLLIVLLALVAVLLGNELWGPA